MLRNPALVEQASELLQLIEDELRSARRQHEAIEPKVRFPRGFINTAQEFRNTYPCRSSRIGNQVAYSMQFLDVLRWLLNRTDLRITAKQMVIKYGIVCFVSVIEGLTFDRLRSSGIAPSKKLRANLRKLRDAGIIQDATYGLLDQLREKREKLHLHLYEESGEAYDVDNWNLAVKGLQIPASDLSRTR
jgi:hypothetical protein